MIFHDRKSELPPMKNRPPCLLQEANCSPHPERDCAGPWALVESEFLDQFFFPSLKIKKSEFQCIYNRKAETQTVKEACSESRQLLCNFIIFRTCTLHLFHILRLRRMHFI